MYSLRKMNGTKMLKRKNVIDLTPLHDSKAEPEEAERKPNKGMMTIWVKGVRKEVSKDRNE